MLLIFISIIVIYYVWKWIPASVGALPDEDEAGKKQQQAL